MGDNKRTKYCYRGYISDFLNTNLEQWLDEMKQCFKINMNMDENEEIKKSLVDSWKDCYINLKKYLVKYKCKNYYMIFEYELELGSGRRPDVIILAKDIVIILEFKQKNMVIRKDILQLQDYKDNIEGYHIASRDKKICPVLVETKMNSFGKHTKNILICSPDKLPTIFDWLNAEDIDYDPNEWIESKYEPLPDIVQAACKIMNDEELPHIRQAESAGIPEALATLNRAVKRAKENKEHILALVTGVPGSGKTLLGLQFAHSNFGSTSKVESVYASGNGPLVDVLQGALKSKVFVKSIHSIITNYYEKDVSTSAKNAIVFDEGQRAWDEERIKAGHKGFFKSDKFMAKHKKLKGVSEPELVINMIDEQLDWSVALILVGSGQEIHKGEEAGLGQWNKAINNSINKWKILCPSGIDKFFDEKEIIDDEDRDKLNLTVSLRSHLAGTVSEWVNNVLDAKIEEAYKLSEDIKKNHFRLYITRDLEEAKRYCLDKYEEFEGKRYGIIASSKSSVLPKFGVDNTYNTTQKVLFSDWYNNSRGEVGSCCNFQSIVTEFGCQGLELDLPILAWENDMIWEGSSWRKYTKSQAGVIDPNMLRVNSYRVLMTRGRDGLIVYVPNTETLTPVYEVLISAGMEQLNSRSL